MDQKWCGFLSQTSFTTGQMCVYKQACLRIIACVCVCMRLQRWSNYDYFGCWSRFRLEGQYVSSPGLAATPDQMAWERKREHLVLWKLWKQHRSSYINFQHWKCDSWKWENITVIQSQMGESHKNMVQVTFHYKIKRNWRLSLGPFNGYYTQK